MTQQELFPTSPAPRQCVGTELSMLRAYERIEAGQVDATGRHQPEGPRKQLTGSHRLILDGYREQRANGLVTWG